MTETLHANLYDFPKYYDLIFGSDWKAEFDFLRACIDKHATRRVRRVFEPACGTGRLLIKLAQAGFEVGGNDLNEKAVDYCNARLTRYGFPASAVVGDMADFRLRRKVDAAFNMINSFRHLSTEKAAEAHLRCVARALAKGGLYLLGLHLTPTRSQPIDREAWSARRGNLSVNSFMWTKKRDRRNRDETLGMTFDVYTPTRQFRIEDEMHYRIYTRPQMSRLLEKVSELEIAETYDFCYEIDHPIRVNATTEDVVYVLRKK
jgi:SAM-dependent methyltransferase